MGVGGRCRGGLERVGPAIWMRRSHVADRSVVFPRDAAGTGVARARRWLSLTAAPTLQEQLLLRGVNSVISGLADSIDEPTANVPQPDFSDCEYLRTRNRPGMRQGLLLGVQDVDPFELIQGDVALLSKNIKELLGSDHPVLATVARYFFDQDGGKKMRPTLVLLMARAARAHEAKPSDTAEQVMKDYKAQARLAEITEMIHTASLLHDDVIDVSDTRRGMKSVNQQFGNKLAILAGDFLLARASVCMARLRNIEVIEVLSTVIEHLVKGEVMQMKSDVRGSEAFEYYLRKNYYKTGSLIANSVMAGTMLAGHSEQVRRIAFDYGESIGHAFQLIDDALDFEGSIASLGKPALADLRQGLATAPVLFAQENYPELKEMIGRKFSGPADIDDAAQIVLQSRSIDQTKYLALAYAEKAIESVLKLKQSPERDALVHLALKVVKRSR